MITLLFGENNFEITRALQQIAASFDGREERVDGTELELKQLPDLLMGATLFAEKRLVIIKNVSENKNVWDALPDWLERVSDDIHLVFVEAKPDKRSRTYKALQKKAEVTEFTPWNERDIAKAEQWTVQEAKQLGFDLDKKSAHTIAMRVGVDQWKLHYALQKLAVVPTVTPEVVEELIEASPTENVFNLLDAALKGDIARVKHMLETLEMTEDPYRLFGLLATQVFQLAVLSVAEAPANEVAKDFGAHPFALSKLTDHVKKLGKSGVRKVAAAMAEADTSLKTSAANPWLLIERALIKISTF
jgi:DNA polymerase III delta subunit